MTDTSLSALLAEVDPKVDELKRWLGYEICLQPHEREIIVALVNAYPRLREELRLLERKRDIYIAECLGAGGEMAAENERLRATLERRTAALRGIEHSLQLARNYALSNAAVGLVHIRTAMEEARAALTRALEEPPRG